MPDCPIEPTISRLLILMLCQPYTVTLKNLAIGFLICFGFSHESSAQDWIPSRGPARGDVANMLRSDDGSVFVLQDNHLFRLTEGGSEIEQIEVPGRVSDISISETGLWIGSSEGLFHWKSQQGLSQSDFSTWVELLSYSTNHGLFIFSGPLLYHRQVDSDWVTLDPPLDPHFRMIFLESGAQGRVFAGYPETTFSEAVILEWKGNSWSRIDLDQHAYPSGISTGTDDETLLIDGSLRSSSLTSSWNDVLVPENLAVLSAIVVDTTLYIGGAGFVHRSVDRGNSWKDLRFGANAATHLAADESGFIYASTSRICQLAVDWVPGACNESGGVFVYRDSLWTPIDFSIGSGGIRAMTSKGDTLFALSNSGVFFSIDHGQKWNRRFDYVRDSQVYLDIANKLVAMENALIAGAARRSDADSSWIPVPGISTVLVELDDGDLLATSNGEIWIEDMILRSSDGGITWEETGGILPRIKSMHKGANDALLVELSDGIYRSEDIGATWNKVANRRSNFTGLYSNGRGVFVAAYTGDVLEISLDNGSSWESYAINGCIQNAVVTANGRAIFECNREYWSFEYGLASSGEIDDTEGWIRMMYEAHDGYLYLGSNGVVRSRALAREVSTEITPRLSGLRVESFPNPFSQSINIRVDLSNSGDVALEIFDGIGRRVVLIYDGPVHARRQSFTWSPADGLSPGIYILVVRTELDTVNSNIVLMN